MADKIDITALKSSNNTEAGTNIDGKEIRDFGNGLKEFDPTANGFEPEKEPEKKSDIDRALEQCDSMIERKKDEVNKFNDLLDQYGGEMTEEELRKEMGQGFVTNALQDGVGGKFEDNPGKTVEVTTPTDEENEEDATCEEVQPKQSAELNELEDELEYEEEQNPVLENIVNNAQKDDMYKYVGRKGLSKGDPGPSDKSFYEHKEKEEVKPKTTPIKSAVANIVNTTDDMSDEDKDLAALDNDDNAPVDDFEAKLKVELEKKMRPVSKKYDLSNAVISNRPVTVSNMISGTTPLNKKIFTWGLMRSKRPITIKSFSATELNVLSIASRNNSRSADVFKSIWEHIVGPAKGKDFHTWCKCTSYFDIDHIWFTIYGACFQDSNYLPFNCTKCNELTVTNDISIYEMCKFTKPEYRDELERIKTLPEEPVMSEVFAEYLTQISDTIVIGFKEPSIYDSMIVPTLLDSEFSQKYEDAIGISAYIANIYRVSENNGQVMLDPISLKVFPNNEVKTIKARIIQFAKVIRSLTSDQYNIILSYINHMAEDETITYGLPATTCDHCHNELPEERNAAADLVFMRHRLAILGA